MAVFVVVGVVGMTRPKAVFDIRVIFGFLIGVVNNHADRSTGGLAFKHAGQNLHLIGLAPLRRKL